MRFLTAGESHGKGLTGILEGVPSGLCLDREVIKNELFRRRSFYGRSERMQIEDDEPEFLGGIRGGITTGAPISFFIKNSDNRLESDALLPITRPRPGHADLAGMIKYRELDARNIAERASGRETVTRVVTGAIAKLILRELGIAVSSHVTSIGNENSCVSYYNGGLAGDFTETADKSKVRCLDNALSEKMIKAIDNAKLCGDTVGGSAELVVRGLTAGYGSLMMYDSRLDYKIAGMMMSIPSVKAVKIGNEAVYLGLGSGAVDPIVDIDGKIRRLNNFCGGIEGGISNGEDIVISITVKPPPTMKSGADTIDFTDFKKVRAHFERSDICVVPSVSVIGEGCLAYVICDTVLSELGGDTLSDIKNRYHLKCEEQEDVLNKNRKRYNP